MAKAVSAKSLFQATKRKTNIGIPLPMDLPEQKREAIRDPLDYDPTPLDATAAFMAREAPFIRAHANRIWEPAVGGGHMAKVMLEFGFEVYGSDVMHRGWPDAHIRNFYDDPPPIFLPVHLTNPPYNEVNASNGHGRWIRRALELGSGYVGLLLNADWSAARINGMDDLFESNPPSLEYICCWKIDFRGLGSPPQRNSWFIWDTNRPAPGPNEWVRKRLYRGYTDPDQLDWLGDRNDQEPAAREERKP